MAEPLISFKDYGFQYLAQASPTLYNINLDIYPRPAAAKVLSGAVLTV